MVRSSIRRAAVVAAVALTVGSGVAGCSDDDDPGAVTTSTSPVTQPAPLPEVEGPFASGRDPLPGFGEVEIRIVEGADGEPIVLCVLVAETPEQRQRGLMGVTDPDLGGYDGMLFEYGEEVEGSFWMKDTPLPLSIAYFDAQGALVGSRDMEPCADGGDCRGYGAPAPFRRALEIPQGDLERVGLRAGSQARLRRTGACDPARE